MEPFTLVIFGITSNLVQIKLIPALYDLAERGLLPKDLVIIGIARRGLSESDFKVTFTIFKAILTIPKKPVSTKP